MDKINTKKSLVLDDKKIKQLENTITKLERERDSIGKLYSDAEKGAEGMPSADLIEINTKVESISHQIKETKKALSKLLSTPYEKTNEGIVGVNKIVTIRNCDDNTVETYTIVTVLSNNYNFDEVSVETPLGNALLGKKVGDVCEFVAPNGTYKVQVLKIQEELENENNSLIK